MADIARRTGAFGVQPEDNDATVLEKFADWAVVANPFFKGDKGNKGDPGGNVMAIGLFANAPGMAIPSGTTAVRTSGYAVTGTGIADYSYDQAVDAAYVAANPKTSFRSADNRGWRLTGARTVTAFGARPGVASAASISLAVAMLSTADLASGMVGDYLAEGAVVVPSGARLVGTGSAAIRQASGINGNVIVNAAYLRTPTVVSGTGAGNNSVSWSVSDPFRLPITWYNHGLQVGDWVWLENTDRTEYNGVFPVIEVGNYANFVVKLEAMPIGNPTGITKVRKADTDIDLDRIVADYDRLNNTDGNGGPQTHTILLAGVAGLHCKAKVRNTKKFGLCLGAVVDVDADLTGWNLYSDGAKVYGPAWRGTIRVLGTFGDDTLSFHPREADQFSAYRFSQGTVRDFKSTVVSGAGANGVSPMVSIYPTTWGGATVGDLDITLHGHTDAPAISILDYSGGSTVGAITVRHDARAKFAVQMLPVQGVTGTTIVQRLHVELRAGAWSNGTDPLVRVAQSCKLEHLHWSGRGEGMGNPSTALLVEGDIGRITCDPAFHYRTAGASFATLSTTTKTLTAVAFSSASIDVSGTAIRADGVALPAGCRISSKAGGKIKTGLDLIDTQSSLALDFQGDLYPGQRVLAMYGTNASVTTITASPDVLKSGEWVTRASGDGKIAPRSFNVKLDIRQAYIQRAAGNYMTMDANTAGTLVAGTMIACNGSATGSWREITDNTKTY